MSKREKEKEREGRPRSLKRGEIPMKRMTLIILLMILPFLFPKETIALLYQGELEIKSHYRVEEDGLKNHMLLEMEIGYLLDHNQFVYLRPRFTLSHLKEEMMVEYRLMESFAYLHLEQVDLRVGRQVTDWGSSYRIQPTERLKPLDFKSRDKRGRGEGLDTIILDYRFGPSTLTGIVARDFAPHILPKKMVEDWVYEMLEEMGVDERPHLVFNEPDLKGLRDNQYALKWMREDLFPGMNLSLSYVWGYEQYPGILEEERERIEEEVARGESLDEMTLTYRETRGLGLHVTTPLAKLLLCLEAHYSMNEEEEKTFEMAVGGEYTWGGGTSTLLQYYQKKEDHILRNEREEVLTLHLKRPLSENHSLHVDTHIYLPERRIHINPVLNLIFADRIKLSIGSFLEGREEGGTLLRGGEEIYTSISYYF